MGIPKARGSIFRELGCQNIHGVPYTMGKRVGLKEPYIPLSGGQNTISRGFSAPWVGGLTYHRQGIRYIMCRGTKYHKRGSIYHVHTIDISRVGASKYTQEPIYHW